MSIAFCSVVPRGPEVEVHVHVFAKRVIEIKKQAFPLMSSIRLKVPRDVGISKAAARTGGGAWRTGECAGVGASFTVAQGTSDRFSVITGAGGDQKGVAAYRNAGRVGERVTRIPRGSSVGPVPVANLLSTEEIRTDREMAASERASPQDAPLPEIAAVLGRPRRACLDLKAFKVAIEHDVDRTADGVSTAQGCGAVSQDLDAFDTRYR